MITVKTLSEHVNVHISHNSSKKINVSGTVIKIGPEEYNGTYNVTPLAGRETVLQTKEKLLHDDVTVEKVPFYSTSNTSGGNTAYIAQSVEE